MEETRTSETLSSATESEKSRPGLPDQWIRSWEELGARVRERPGLHFLDALAIGYLLQAIPCRTREMDVFMNIPSAYFAGTSPFGFPKESVTWLRPD